MCSHTKHLRDYLPFPSHPYYNKSVKAFSSPHFLGKARRGDGAEEKGDQKIYEKKKELDVTFQRLRKKTRGGNT